MSPYEYFIDTACQVDFENRLFHKKLTRYERMGRILSLLVMLFAPGSAVSGGIAEMNLWPRLTLCLTPAWQLMMWITTVAAIAGAVFVTPPTDKLRESVNSLDKLLCQFKVVLDAVHYQDADGSDWIQMARQATEAYSAAHFTEQFTAGEREQAWQETLAVYGEYLEAGGAKP